ncbi:hypothetical protein IAR55_001748 [Kwoniella newhampshirensis]|uniref:Uncharacterized protein n=1 Tax=Kwoniella newhampshirensis TaxID=1651941 RepID=A0AAW0Z2X6_9TREE
MPSATRGTRSKHYRDLAAEVRHNQTFSKILVSSPPSEYESSRTRLERETVKWQKTLMARRELKTDGRGGFDGRWVMDPIGTSWDRSAPPLGPEDRKGEIREIPWDVDEESTGETLSVDVTEMAPDHVPSPSFPSFGRTHSRLRSRLLGGLTSDCQQFIGFTSSNSSSLPGESGSVLGPRRSQPTVSLHEDTTLSSGSSPRRQEETPRYHRQRLFDSIPKSVSRPFTCSFTRRVGNDMSISVEATLANIQRALGSLNQGGESIYNVTPRRADRLEPYEGEGKPNVTMLLSTPRSQTFPSQSRRIYEQPSLTTLLTPMMISARVGNDGSGTFEEGTEGGRRDLSTLENEKRAYQQGLAGIQRRMEEEGRSARPREQDQTYLHTLLQQKDQALVQAWNLLNQVPAGNTSSSLTSPHIHSRPEASHNEVAALEVAHLEYQLADVKRDLANEIDRRRKVELDCDSAKKGQSAQARMAQGLEVRAKEAEERLGMEKEAREDLQRRLAETQSQSKTDPTLMRELEMKRIQLVAANREKQETLSKVRSSQHEYSKLADKLKALRLEKEALQARITELVGQNQELDKIKEDKKVLRDALTKERATTERLRRERDTYRAQADRQLRSKHEDQSRSKISSSIATQIQKEDPIPAPSASGAQSMDLDHESECGPPVVIDDFGGEFGESKVDGWEREEGQDIKMKDPLQLDIKSPKVNRMTPPRPSMTSPVLQPVRKSSRPDDSLLGPETDIRHGPKEAYPSSDFGMKPNRGGEHDVRERSKPSESRASQQQKLDELATFNSDPFADIGQAFGQVIASTLNPINHGRSKGGLTL